MSTLLAIAFALAAQAPTAPVAPKTPVEPTVEPTAPVEAAAPPARKATVLPISVPPRATEDVKRAARAVERTLSEALRRHSDLRLMRHEDVVAMASEAVKAQMLGCDEDSCLAQIAEALDVDVVVRTQLAVHEGVWDLRAVMLERKSAKAGHRASTQGRSLDALLLGVDGVARELAKGSVLAWEDERLAERLGTTDEVLREVRASAPGTAVNDAWSAYLLDHNVEGELLPVIEGLLLLAGGLVLAGGAVAASPINVIANTAIYFAPVLQSPSNPDPSTPYRFPVLLIALAAGSTAAVIVAGAALFSAAGVAGVVDALDLGRKPVAREGCCRDEAKIRDAASPGWGRTIAPLLAVGGAAAMVLSVVLAIPTSIVVSTIMGADTLGAIAAGPLGAGPVMPLSTYRVVAGALLLVLVFGTLFGTVGLALIPLGGAVGLIATRHRELVDDQPLPVAREDKRGKR